MYTAVLRFLNVLRYGWAASAILLLCLSESLANGRSDMCSVACGGRYNKCKRMWYKQKGLLFPVPIVSRV